MVPSLGRKSPWVFILAPTCITDQFARTARIVTLAESRPVWFRCCRTWGRFTSTRPKNAILQVAGAGSKFRFNPLSDLQLLQCGTSPRLTKGNAKIPRPRFRGVASCGLFNPLNLYNRASMLPTAIKLTTPAGQILTCQERARLGVGAVSPTLTALHLADVPLPTARFRPQGSATQPVQLSGGSCRSVYR